MKNHLLLILGLLFMSNTVLAYTPYYQNNYSTNQNQANGYNQNIDYSKPKIDPIFPQAQNNTQQDYQVNLNTISKFSNNGNQYQQPQFYTPPQQVSAYASPLQGNVVMIPTGTSISGVTSTNYSTTNLYVGSPFSVTLPSGFYYQANQVAPSGSVVNGVVVDVRKAGRATRNAMLNVKFTSIVTPYGQTIPITGKLRTNDGSGILYGGTKTETAKEYAKDATIGAAGGAIMGTVMGALSGGKVGKGAAYGTAVGAGAGVAKSLWDRGGEIEIPANSAVEIVLEQPATYSPVQYR